MADAPSCFLILSEEQLDRKMPRVSAVGGRETLSLGWFSARGPVPPGLLQRQRPCLGV